MTYEVACAQSEARRQDEIGEAQRRFRDASDRLIAGRPRYSGSAEAEAGAVAERTKLAEAQKRRDTAITVAERDHADRLAAAGRHYGITNFATGNHAAGHANAWLAAHLGLAAEPAGAA